MTAKIEYIWEYFGRVFTQDDGSVPAVKSRIEESISFDSIDFSVDIQETNIGQAYFIGGPDGLPNVTLKNLASSISVPLSYIFNSSFDSHYPPLQWLQAHMLLRFWFSKGDCIES